MDNEILKAIVEFNTNPDNQRIKNYYREDNIWNILKKSRSEEAHSAFIAWLLSTKEKDDETISPLMSFLNLLMLKADNGQFDSSLKSSIIDGTIHLDIHPAETEKTISSLTDQKIRFDDRLDVYMLCDIKVGNYDQLEIIIENKVGAPEGRSKTKIKIDDQTEIEKRYAKESQTKKYYYALCCKNSSEDNMSSGIMVNNKKIQLFVFLAPNNKKCDSDKYITITYQELYDYVIKTFARRNDITDKQKLYVDDYIRILGTPLYKEEGNNNNKDYLIMANTDEEKALFVNFLKNNMPLIVKAADVLSSEDEANTDDINTLVQTANSLSKMVGVYGTYEIRHHQKPIVKSDKWATLVKTTLQYIVYQSLCQIGTLNKAFNNVRDNTDIILDQNGYDAFIKKGGFKGGDKNASQRYNVLDQNNPTKYYYYREWGVGNIDKFFDFIKKLNIDIEVEKID